MATDRDQPWWAEAQDYRHRETRRRALDSDPIARGDEFSADAARRRRAAAARAAAQERRARQRRRSAPAEFGWVDESPFASHDDERAYRRSRDASRRVRDRSRRPGERTRSSSDVLPVRASRTSRRPARRRTSGLIARPERLLLYAALLGLFLVLAAASTSDAAVLPHVVLPSR